jgi:hypothetical protein
LLSELGEGMIILSPRSSQVDELADKLANEWREAGMSLESMLSALRQVRKDRNADGR